MIFITFIGPDIEFKQFMCLAYQPMLQLVGVDVATKQILWIKVRPDYEPLFAILEGLLSDGERCYCIECLVAQEDNCIIKADSEKMSTGVEIVLQMSDKTSTCLANTLTRAEEYM